MSHMLSEMTAMMGCDEHAGERAWITDTNIRWQDDFLLSGSTVGLTNHTNSSQSTAQRVWRFTPSDPTSFAPSSASYGTSHVRTRDIPGNISIPVHLHVYGKPRPCTLVFVDALFRAPPNPPLSSSAPHYSLCD